MSTVFINKGPQSGVVWRTSPEDKLAIAHHLKQGKGKSRRRNIGGKSYVLSSSGHWRLAQTLQAPIEPSTLLDGGRIDPFITYPVPNVPVSSRSTIDHGGLLGSFFLCQKFPDPMLADKLGSAASHMDEHCPCPGRQIELSCSGSMVRAYAKVSSKLLRLPVLRRCS